MVKKTKSPYSGDLLKRLPRRKRYGPEIQDDPEWNAEHKRKFQLLLDHYGIARGDPSLWANLACDLIRDHVPGLAELKAPGRPREDPIIPMVDRARLLREVEALKKRSPEKLADITACERLHSKWLRQEPPHVFKGKSVSFLRKALTAARREGQDPIKKSIIERWLDPPGRDVFGLPTYGGDFPTADLVFGELLRPLEDTEAGD